MLALPKPDAKPTEAASDTDRPGLARVREAARQGRGRRRRRRATATSAAAAPVKERLFAHPARSNAMAAGGAQQEFLRTGRIDGALTPALALGIARDQIVIKKLKVGSQVPAGTVLGRIGAASSRTQPFVRFEIRPAGRGAPRVDPKPILDGWKLLESTAIYRAKGKNPFVGPDAATPTIGQILLMSKETLQQRVLADPRIQIYDCGRQDIQAGQIDRRVLATLEFLVASGLNPTVTSLNCGHSYLSASGNVSEHSTGTAVDIAAVNGIPILGNQGKGSITELVIQRLLTLQGTMKPHQIISLMTFPDADNTLSLADHDDHIHIGFRPRYGTNSKLSKQLNAVLKPSAVDPPDRAPRQDRQPDGPGRAVEVRDQGQEGPLTDDPRSFRFMQWEFAGRLGPPPGRYVVRRYAGDASHEVVVVTEADAPRRRPRRSPPAGTVPVTRVTVIDASSGLDPAAADWRRRAPTRASPASCPPIASPPPTPARPTRTARCSSAPASARARNWPRAPGRRPQSSEAPEPPRVRRRSKHRPAERLAALLSARDVSLACEELTLRARADLDFGRHPEAALQLEAALSAAVAELAGWVTPRRPRRPPEELRECLDPVRGAALAAREGRLEPAGVEVGDGRALAPEAALRARPSTPPSSATTASQLVHHVA